MTRISGIEMNKKKHVVISIRKIYGIGKSNSLYICKKANILPHILFANLNEKQILNLQKIINKFETEGDLRTRVRLNIKRLKDINCYKGNRHKRSLPVRGQRTKTNANTCKNKKK